MTAEISLQTGGSRFGGWTGVSVSRSIEAFSGSFSFTASEKSPADPLGRPILMGDSAVVRIGDVALITGHIDKIDPGYDKNTHTIRVSGRSKTADLVDCSAIHEPGLWLERTLEQIAAELTKPFGIKVRVESATGLPFSTFKLEPSETVHGAIVRAAGLRAILVTDNGAGDLVLTRVGPARAGVELRKGDRILSARGSFSDRDRFSIYTVMGQRRSTDSDGDNPQTQVSAEAKDLGIKRFRPLDILAEEPGSVANYRDRAKWEATTRQGKALRATLTVQDWEHPGGLWLPNQRVNVDDAWLGIRREMLITGVTWILDESGRRTELSIMPPEALELLATPDISAESGVLWNVDEAELLKQRELLKKLGL